jgi:hypothetical protein
MTLTMYEMTIPTMLRGFGALSRYLERAEEFVRVSGLKASHSVQARPAPDMLTFAGQIQRASDKAKGGVAKLAGIESPSFPDAESTFEELDARVAKTVLFLRPVDAKLFDGSEWCSVDFPNLAGFQMRAAVGKVISIATARQLRLRRAKRRL